MSLRVNKPLRKSMHLSSINFPRPYSKQFTMYSEAVLLDHECRALPSLLVMQRDCERTRKPNDAARLRTHLEAGRLNAEEYRKLVRASLKNL